MMVWWYLERVTSSPMHLITSPSVVVTSRTSTPVKWDSSSWLERMFATLHIRRSRPFLLEMTACLENMMVAARAFGRDNLANTIPAMLAWGVG